MPELLLELLSEEIPARMQARAAADLKRLVSEGLKAAGLGFDSAVPYVTPRRLALVVDGLPVRQPEIAEERKGPRVGAPEAAIQGFLRSVGLASLEHCEQRDTGKGVFWFAAKTVPGKPTADVLAGVISNAISSLTWPRSMRWADNAARWVRPLRGALAVFDGAALAFDFDLHAGRSAASRTAQATLAFGDRTTGHRFLAPGELRVTGFPDYREKLRGSFVLVDQQERRRKILADAERLVQAADLSMKRDDSLLDEVVGLVEWPEILIGRIDDAFMDLPPEVLTTAMRAHQKYFSLTDAEGRLAPRFLIVSNMPHGERDEAIVAGNERVLRARLSDARFFWDQDRKVRLEDRLAALKGIVFHARLGTVADKALRIQALVAELIPAISRSYGIDMDLTALIRDAERAAQLCKADLTSGMVGEFPELQGVMGRYYARNDGEAPAVAEAVAEHYAPLGPNDRCPTAPASVAVALADKIDTLVGFFGIGEKPTGSRDPFALRRAALGVIRLIVENKLRVPLAPTLRRAALLYAEQPAAREHRFDAQELLAFVADRLKVALRERGVRHDLISAVFALGGEDDLVRLLGRVDALRAFLDSDDGANLLTAYRRASNIVRIEEKRDGATYDGAPDAALLSQAEEIALSDRLSMARERMSAAIAAERFENAMQELAQLRPAVDSFFDRVTVNCDDPKLRANRLRLLSQIRATLGSVADLASIEG